MAKDMSESVLSASYSLESEALSTARPAPPARPAAPAPASGSEDEYADDGFVKEVDDDDTLADEEEDEVSTLASSAAAPPTKKQAAPSSTATSQRGGPSPDPKAAPPVVGGSGKQAPKASDLSYSQDDDFSAVEDDTGSTLTATTATATGTGTTAPASASKAGSAARPPVAPSTGAASMKSTSKAAARTTADEESVAGASESSLSLSTSTAITSTAGGRSAAPPTQASSTQQQVDAAPKAAGGNNGGYGRSSVMTSSYGDASFDSEPVTTTTTASKRGATTAAASQSTRNTGGSDTRTSDQQTSSSKEEEGGGADSNQRRDGGKEGGVDQGSGQAQRPKSSRAQAAAAALLDDSWEGELRILPASHHSSQSYPSHPQPAPQQQGSHGGARPMSARPVSARPVSAVGRSHRGSDAGSVRSSAAGSAITHSGSLIGSLVSSPPPGAGRARPMSAGPRDRQAALLSDLTRRHPATWDVRDVAMWVEYIGLGQYRKKFSHNCIDGRLLLAITDQQLKVELGIGPMGHRAALLDAVAALAQEAEDMEGGSGSGSPSPQRRPIGGAGGRPSSARPLPTQAPQQEFPRRPASASKPGIIPPDPFLGPALGKVTVYEQRAKLLFELDRAAARAAQHRTLAHQLAHTAHLSEEEVSHLRGLLSDLEKRNKIAVQHAVGGLDSKARVPWRPVGWGSQVLNPHPERFGRPGDDPSIDMTWHPKISPMSKRILSESYGQSGASAATFLDRLETDAKRRERARTEADRKYYSQEALYGDPMLAKRRAAADWSFLTRFFVENGITDEPMRQEEGDEIIDSTFRDRGTGDWRMREHVVQRVLAAKGPKKVAAAAAAIRTMQFMQRYDVDISGRDSRLVDLQKKWWESAMGRPRSQKEAEDMDQAVKYFSMLGWKGEDAITDDRLSALLRRVTAYKQQYEKWRDQQAAGAGADAVPGVDWNSLPWSADGLTALQEAEIGSIQGAAEGGAGAEAAGGAGNVAKTPLAPPGNVQVGPAADVGLDYLSYTVRLLARARWDDLQKLDAMSGRTKQLGVYRSIRTQKFIEFTETEIRNKDRRLREAYEQLQRPKRVIGKEEMDGFFSRLLDDASKRVATHEKLQADKLQKEAEIIKSSQMYKARPRTAR